MSQDGFEVLCAGILVADLFVPLLPRLPAAGELLKVDDMLLDTGGCAANTATDLARLGVRVAVAGKVGADFFGEFIRKDLSLKGLADVSGIRMEPRSATSQTVILPVRGEDRRYVHSLGANAWFSLEDIDLDAVARAKVLYVGGYLILPRLDPASLAWLLRFARERGARTVLDVAGVDPKGAREALAEVLPHTDFFVPNEDEARLITAEMDPARQAERLRSMGAGTVIVTQGEKGATVAPPDGSLLHVDAYLVDFVDASGSGDAFDAGLIVGLLEGWDIRKTLTFASAIGASCCTHLGCTAGVFSRPQAEAFMASRELAMGKVQPSTPRAQ